MNFRTNFAVAICALSFSLSAQAGGVIEDKTAIKASAKQSNQARATAAPQAKAVDANAAKAAASQKAKAGAKTAR